MCLCCGHTNMDSLVWTLVDALFIVNIVCQSSSCFIHSYVSNDWWLQHSLIGYPNFLCVRSGHTNMDSLVWTLVDALFIVNIVCQSSSCFIHSYVSNDWWLQHSLIGYPNFLCVRYGHTNMDSLVWTLVDALFTVNIVCRSNSVNWKQMIYLYILYISLDYKYVNCLSAFKAYVITMHVKKHVDCLQY